MFRKKVIPFNDVLSQVVRAWGLETPLMQRRAIQIWDEVAGPVAARYTEEKFIRNQTLFVKIANPALRHDLTMRRTELQNQINAKVGAFTIAEIKIY